MTTRLLIIRHGNTFNADEPARRVGRKTDIPLVQSGVGQAEGLGAFLAQENLIPDHVFASELIRAQQTAKVMIERSGAKLEIQTDKTFNEIDHGADENKTDADIIARIGKKALEDWADFGVVPDGWDVDPRAVQKSWVEFADECLAKRGGDLTCVVSSGGIIRFAPILTGGELPVGQTPKVKTASMGLFTHDGRAWTCAFWNKRAV